MFKVETTYEYAHPKYFGPEHLTTTEEFFRANAGDNRNDRFTKKIYELFPDRQLWIMELGTGGGGAIEPFVKDGHKAIGLDGSYLYKKFMHAAWKNIPNNLFCADLSHHFNVVYSEDCWDWNHVFFDVIFSYEVIEHLYPDDIPVVFENIQRHLKKDGVFIGSISHVEDGHQTVNKDRNWWLDQFKKYGLVEKTHVNDKMTHHEHIRQEGDSHYFYLNKI